MKKLTAEQRKKERSIIFALVIDVLADIMIVVLAIVTGSLTLMGEAIRSVIMLALLAYTFQVLRAVHRGNLAHFSFGVAKLENFASALLGLSLIFSGLWVAQTVIDTLFAARAAAGPFDLAAAALTNAVNALLNVINWLVVRGASTQKQSEVFKAQLHGRFVMMMSSLFLQLTLTAAALAQDPVLALSLDALGAGFVTFLMIRNGLVMFGRSLPTLLDARASEDLRRDIAEAVRAEIPQAKLLSLRSRLAGETCVAEVTLASDPQTPPSVLCEGGGAAEERLRRAGHHVDLAIVPIPGPDEAGSPVSGRASRLAVDSGGAR